MPETDNILKTGATKQKGSYRMQAVEPATGLVDGFTNVIGGEPPILKQVLILKGVVVLGYRHGSGIKPAINHLWHPPHLCATPRTIKGYFIHKGPMQIQGLF
ncbi:hypothetical protein ES703_116366 [subsurface metagenome]